MGAEGPTGPVGPPVVLDTIQIESTGAGNVCVTCPLDHPLMMGGACQRQPCAAPGFGASTTIDTTTYCCESIGAICDVRVSAVCADLL